MSILINDGKVADEDIIKCDIGEFVILVEKLRRHTRPAINVLNYGIAIFRWEKPLLTILTVVFCCGIFIVNPVFMVICILLPIPPWLVVEYVRMSCRRSVPNKVYSDYVQIKDESYQQYLKQAAQEKQRERLNMFLDIIVGLQRIFVDVIEYFEHLQGVITWKRKKPSLLLLLGCLLIELSLYVLDVRIVLCVVTICWFFINRYFILAVKRSVTRSKYFVASLLLPSPKKSKTESTDKSLQIVPFTAEETIETMQPEDVDSSYSSESDEDISDKKEEAAVNPSHSQSGFAMSKLIPRTWRKRYMAGNCSNCDQPSSSILKKRRYCRHCGKSFCSRCCSIRVPRAFLGATAPAAYQEKVLVCEVCHVFLANRMKTTPTELVGE